MPTIHRAPVVESRFDAIREIDVDDALELSVVYDVAFPWKRSTTRTRVTSRIIGGAAVVGSLENDDVLSMRFVASPLPVSSRETLLHQTIVVPRRLPRALAWIEAPLASAWAQMVWHQSKADGRIWAKQEPGRPRLLLPCEAPIAQVHRHFERHL